MVDPPFAMVKECNMLIRGKQDGCDREQVNAVTGKREEEEPWRILLKITGLPKEESCFFYAVRFPRSYY
jgi:hypothetical protein